jgi:hypothetical protein
MATMTTAYYTLTVERSGTSGPENELRIEDFIAEVEAQTWKDTRIEISIGSHDYETFTESVD